MSRGLRLFAVGLGVLLLAAPVASACGASPGTGEGCPMARSMDGPMCHGGGEASMDCCVSGPAPEPLQASASEGAKLVTVLEGVRLEAVAPFAPQRADGTPIEILRFHDRGRYTLFSSFLL